MWRNHRQVGFKYANGKWIECSRPQVSVTLCRSIICVSFLYLRKMQTLTKFRSHNSTIPTWYFDKRSFGHFVLHISQFVKSPTNSIAYLQNTYIYWALETHSSIFVCFIWFVQLPYTWDWPTAGELLDKNVSLKTLLNRYRHVFNVCGLPTSTANYFDFDVCKEHLFTAHSTNNKKEKKKQKPLNTTFRIARNIQLLGHQRQSIYLHFYVRSKDG